jgi:processive 1,2-diacylglycerol beta-glucosyltransferase
MKKLLIVSASAGAGHVRAAQALEATAKISHPDWEVLHLDIVDYISVASRKLFFESYELIATELPKLWGFFYNSIDVPKRQEQFDKVTSILKKLQSKKFITAVNKFGPDYILCTHFTPPDGLNKNRAKLKTNPRIGVVITDYGLHQLWSSCGADDFFVGTEKMRWKLILGGQPETDTFASGIPIFPAFNKNNLQSTNLKRKFEVSDNKKIILVLSGGQGMAGIENIVESLYASQQSLHVFAIVGNNQKRLDSLESLVTPDHITLSAIGWTDKIEEYMAIADVIVSKSGGLTVSEVIAMQKPFIVINPIPGQEERNAEHILVQGYGKIAHTTNDLLYYIGLEADEIAPGYKNLKNKRPAAQVILAAVESKMKMG